MHLRHYRIAALVAAFAFSGSAYADTLVYSNNFNSGSTAGFSSGSVVTAPSGEMFLGSFTEGASTTLTLTGLAAHSSFDLNFTLDAVGSMDGDGYNGAPIYGGGPGDYFQVTTGGATIFNQAFANYGGGEVQSYPTDGSAPTTGATAVNGLGYSGFPQNSGGAQDAEYNFVLSGIMSSSSTLSITFQSLSNEDVNNEFYGIDNVTVSIGGSGVAPVPLPASAPMFGAALLAVGAFGYGLKRRRVISAA